MKSKRGVEFRRWATDVLRRYVMASVVENRRRLQQLSQAVQVIRRLPDELESGQILDIVQAYTSALDLLDGYDHQRIARPSGFEPVCVLDYSACGYTNAYGISRSESICAIMRILALW